MRSECGFRADIPHGQCGGRTADFRVGLRDRDGTAHTAGVGSALHIGRRTAGHSRTMRPCAIRRRACHGAGRQHDPVGDRRARVRLARPSTPEQRSRHGIASRAAQSTMSPIVIAAHNEELVIADDDPIGAGGRRCPALQHLCRLRWLERHDGRSPATSAERPGARAGSRTVARPVHSPRASNSSELADTSRSCMLLDADTQPEHPTTWRTGLPLFDDHGRGGRRGAGGDLSTDPARRRTSGASWSPTASASTSSCSTCTNTGRRRAAGNVVSIVPGFASMYRTRILGRHRHRAPGLAIEDYNMTFEVHAKNLGRIAFHPGAAIALHAGSGQLPATTSHSCGAGGSVSGRRFGATAYGSGGSGRSWRCSSSNS